MGFGNARERLTRMLPTDLGSRLSSNREPRLMRNEAWVTSASRLGHLKNGEGGLEGATATAGGRDGGRQETRENQARLASKVDL